MKLSNVQILVLRLTIGALFLSLSLHKYNDGWLSSPEHLASSLNSYQQHAAGAQLAYLEAIAMPYAGAWSKLIPAGEFLLGISLLAGLLVRSSALLGVFMVLNFHAANGNLFSLSFFGSPWAALLVGGMVILMLARAGRWSGVDALLAKPYPKSLLW